MVEHIRKMRATTILFKDSPTKKRKALIEVAPTPFDEDEHTNSGLVFKKKKLEVAPPLNTPTQMVELHITRSSPSKRLKAPT